MSNLVPVPSVREVVKGSGPLTAVVTGPVSSIGAAVVRVPVETVRGFVVGVQDAIDTSTAKSGILEGIAPRWLQNIAAFGGSALVYTGVGAALGFVLGTPIEAITIGFTLAAIDTAPGKQTADGLVTGASSLSSLATASPRPSPATTSATLARPPTAPG